MKQESKDKTGNLVDIELYVYWWLGILNLDSN